MAVSIENGDNVYFAKKGAYNGGIYTFTHRDPKSGELWGEDIPVGKNPTEYGKWVAPESVTLDWNRKQDNTKQKQKPKTKTARRNKERRAREG